MQGDIVDAYAEWDGMLGWPTDRREGASEEKGMTPLTLTRCALCSAREGIDVYVIPGHGHAEEARASARFRGFRVSSVTLNGVRFPVTGWATVTPATGDVAIPAGCVAVGDTVAVRVP